MTVQTFLKAAQSAGLAHNNGAGGEYLLVGTANQLEALERALMAPGACVLCGGTGRYGDGANDGSGRWIECPCGAHDMTPPAPFGWWTDELEKIFAAREGAPITADMKRAAHIALTVARGGRWDDEKQEWTHGVDLPDGGQCGN